MGVDATLFVLGAHSDFGVGFVEHAFSLSRNRDLWPLIEAVPTTREWPRVQLPLGSWVTYSDGWRPGGGRADSESGYLAEDSYGGKMLARAGRDLAALPTESSFNRAVLDFIGAHFGDHDVVVFWH
jgi:hypothetical protein